MLYDLLDKPPKPGSALEALCLMIQLRRQLIQLHQVRVVVQATLSDRENADSVQEVKDAFVTYRSSLLPYLEEEIDREHKALVAALKAETSRGPMRISKVQGSSRGEKLRAKLQDRPLRRPRPVRRRRRW